MEIQITAIKFETVNGKKTGKSFAFKLDPKKMAVYKTEATLRKKIEEYVAKSGVFKKEERYWLELLSNGNFCGRSDNIKGVVINDFPYDQFYDIFTLSMERV